MNSLPTSNGPGRIVRAVPAAGLALLTGPRAWAADGHTFAAFDLGLGLVVGLVTGLLVWAYQHRRRRHLEQWQATRIKEMSALIEHADGLLWEAEVDLKPGDWAWKFKLHPSAFCRRLFHVDRMVEPGTDLWDQFHIDNRKEMDARARQAMENNQPGYVQEFRAERGGHSVWMHENVSITKLGPNRYFLVGLVTDITPQREAEAARRQSELTVERILAHADCLLWRATVILEEGVLKWPHFDTPPSRFSELLFGERHFTYEKGFWESLVIPEQSEMDERSTKAILGGEPGYEQRFRAINKAGRLFWLQERVSINRVAEKIWSLVGVVMDITSQHEAEEARRMSEQRLSYLLERTDSMIWQAQVQREPDGRLAWSIFVPKSQLHRRIFSADPVGNIGFDWKGHGVAEHVEMEHRAFEAIISGAPGYEQTIHVPSPTGDFWLSEKVTIVPGGRDQWDLVGIITDITARHVAEDAWRASQASLGKVLELADCLVWDATVTLGADDILHWDIHTQLSVLYRRIFGERSDTLLDWHLVQVPELNEMSAQSLRAVKSASPGYSHEFHVEKPEGDIWLREAVTLTQLTGDTFRLVGVITDITAQRRAELAQQQSELRLQALLERADLMIWQGRTTRVNPDKYDWKIFTPRSQLFRRIFGHDPDGRPIFNWGADKRVPEDAEMMDRCIRALREGWPGYEQVFHYEHPTEGDIWLNEKVSIRPLDPHHCELIGIITDITAQHQSEVARKASEQRLQELLTRADCLLWEATVLLQPDDWKWEFNIQPSLLCLKLYGMLNPSPTVGLWRDFMIPERATMDLRCRTAMQEGRPGYEQVFRVIRGDKPVVWISESVTIKALGGNRFSLVGVALDITPQRGAEEALAAEKERLAVTLRAMSECVITTDVTGLVEFMNPAVTTLTGWEEATAVGRPVAEICQLQNSRSDQPVAVPVAQVVRDDLVADLPAQTRLVTRAGARRLIEGRCAPIHAADGRVIGTVLVFRDVTEQDRLEQELVRATRLESVGVLAGGIAHDFNNILTAVMGNLALAQLDVEPETPVGASLRSAEKAALRARDLTQQLLTFAKGGEPVRAAVQLDAVVREMAAFALHGSQVKASFDMAPDLWPADADKGQIGRVVQNIVLNAVQAMPQGGTLRITARNDSHDSQSQPGLQKGDYIQIAITDTGVGIKPEDLARIFDPYFTTKQTGTGLGLAAVYSIVKKHRGHIEVESQPGQGTTFRIWLPALHQQVKPDSKMPWDGTPDQLQGRVLFMDDEPIICQMASLLLQRYGLTVDSAADGAEAVAKYRAALAAGTRYDLVIMDLTVPGGMGGLAAIGQLREIDPAVKAVVSSGYSSDPVLANFRSHGFVAVMAKPYQADELSRVLHEVLG